MYSVMKKVSVVTPCFNEFLNIEIVYEAVKAQFEKLSDINYEHIFIDNYSTDGTRDKLLKIAEQDKNVKLIFNARNFGPVRSPYYGLMQTTGDAAMLFVADLQDPPELIPVFINLWLSGSKVVVGVKPKSHESKVMFFVRTMYYKILRRISEIDLIENYTGFGIYDKEIIDELRVFKEPYPFFRGLVCEVATSIQRVEYIQPVRMHGKSKYSFYDLFDVAMSGITAHSKIPLRLATFAGFVLGFFSLLLSLIYLTLKLIWWDTFPFGLAPLLIGIFLFGSIQLISVGLLGEYLLSVLVYAKDRPLVKESRRINF